MTRTEIIKTLQDAIEKLKRQIVIIQDNPCIPFVTKTANLFEKRTTLQRLQRVLLGHLEDEHAEMTQTKKRKKSA